MEIRAFFEMKTFSFFLVFTPEFVEIPDENLCFLFHILEIGALKFFCSPKFVYGPQSSYPSAGPGLHQNSIVFFEVSVSGLGHSELGPTLQKRKADRAYLNGNTGCMS